MKTTKKQRLELSEIWFNSQLKQSKPCLVISCYDNDSGSYFSICEYSFNPINGVSYTKPIEGYKDLNYKEMKAQLNNN